MINLSYNSQELNQEEFNQLSLQQKHAYLDNKMGARIKLSYNLAINKCRSLIDSNEKLSKAFQNFQEMKNPNSNNYTDKEVLSGAFVDKIKARIYLVINIV